MTFDFDLPDNFPEIGNLYKVAGSPDVVLVLGNHLGPDGTLWCANFETGDRVYVYPERLVPCISIAWGGLKQSADLCARWAEQGVEHAADWIDQWNQSVDIVLLPSELTEVAC